MSGRLQPESPSFPLTLEVLLSLLQLIVVLIKRVFIIMNDLLICAGADVTVLDIITMLAS